MAGRFGTALRALGGEAAAIQPSLHADGLTLIPFAGPYYGAWFDATSSCEAYLRRWQPTWPPGHLSEPSYRARLGYWRRSARAGRGFAWHVFAHDTLIGAAELTGIERGASRSCRLGYWIAERAAGAGHGTATAVALCEYVFGPLGLYRVEASCAPANAASLRVLSKAGFRREGLARAYLEIDGDRRDHLILARLASDD